MSRIKVYNTHTEITNGLFIDTENKKHSIIKFSKIYKKVGKYEI